MSLASGRVEGEAPFLLCWVVAISVVKFDKTRSAYPHASRFDRPQLQSPLLAAMWSYMIFEGLS
jgi:hypothetical protein